MKTVKPAHGGLPERVKDEKAKELVDSGTHVYCGKIEWKKQVRDASKDKAIAKAKESVEAAKAATPTDDPKKLRAETKAQALAAKKARIAEVNKKIAEEHKHKSKSP